MSLRIPRQEWLPVAAWQDAGMTPTPAALQDCVVWVRYLLAALSTYALDRAVELVFMTCKEHKDIFTEIWLSLDKLADSNWLQG